jgi:hypothetical protein
LIIVIGEWFWIPHVGEDVFRNLVKDAHLQYDKSLGFQFTSDTNIDLVTAIFESAFKEDVKIFLKCFICNEPVECEECRYNDVCQSSKIFQSCICKKCYSNAESLSLYSIRFTEFAD